MIALLLLPSVASADGSVAFMDPALFYRVTSATTGDTLTVSSSGEDYAVIDSSHPITSDAYCTLDDGNTRATCPVDVGVYLTLSDFDDTLTASSLSRWKGVRVEGGGGNDVLASGPGGGTLIGGPGDDILWAFNSAGDTVDCGPGFDRIFIDRVETIGLDCEVVNGELRDFDEDGLLDAADDCPTDAGPGTSSGCPADTAACKTARDRLAQAKERLKKLRRVDAPRTKIKQARRKVDRRRDVVAAACGT